MTTALPQSVTAADESIVSGVLEQAIYADLAHAAYDLCGLVRIQAVEIQPTAIVTLTASTDEAAAYLGRRGDEFARLIGQSLGYPVTLIVEPVDAANATESAR